MDARAPAFGYSAPWGYAATVGWVVVAFVVSAGVAFVCSLLWLGGDFQRATTTPYDGVLVTIGSLSSTPVQIAILAYAAIRKGWPVDQYFSLAMPRAREAGYAVAIMVVVMFALEGTLFLMSQDLVPPFQIDAYRTAKAAGWLPGLFLAVVIFAPVGEEIIFRGFMYRGFARRPGQEPYAIVILAAAWTILHLQYDWVGLLQVFIVGLFFGWVRWATGSTLLTIMLHMLMNLEAMTETLIRVDWMNS
jgi:membrane protease YdiL (CAAX protease family)